MLACLIALLIAVILVRECTYAVAEGNVGQVCGCLKVM